MNDSLQRQLLANPPGRRDTVVRRAKSGLVRSLDRAGARTAVLRLKLAIAAGLFRPYQPIPALGIRVSKAREAAVFARWDAMKAELPAAPASLLDVGCNIGFYVVESARLGHFAAGLDTPNFSKALEAVKRGLSLNNVNPIGVHLTPEVARSLPQYDCIIMLQVFHHLCVSLGQESALKILATLSQKARMKFFFETEFGAQSEEPFGSALPDMGGDVDAWCARFFGDLGCRDMRVIYRDVERGRPLFVIEK